MSFNQLSLDSISEVSKSADVGVFYSPGACPNLTRVLMSKKIIRAKQNHLDYPEMEPQFSKLY